MLAIANFSCSGGKEWMKNWPLDFLRVKLSAES